MRVECGVDPLPVGVGDLDEQRVFLQQHASFLKHYPVLKNVAGRALCRPLAPPSQAEIDHLQGRNDDENAATTDEVVFFLGRIVVDDFGEIIILWPSEPDKASIRCTVPAISNRQFIHTQTHLGWKGA